MCIHLNFAVAVDSLCVHILSTHISTCVFLICLYRRTYQPSLCIMYLCICVYVYLCTQLLYIYMYMNLCVAELCNMCILVILISQFVVSFIRNLQSQSQGSLFYGTWHSRTRLCVFLCILLYSECHLFVISNLNLRGLFSMERVCVCVCVFV